ncbi:MAG: mannosyl-3-phosphoglycerate phosphatase family protein [Halioglobus sp.]|jgi:mannosyl-3-phosphoglycerate phosphatase family protein
MTSHKLLVFTDMDGSLLDHYSYSHAAADDLLATLNALGIPVIPNTSKTRAEIEHIRLELKNHHPFIAENGAAVFLPKNIFEQPPVDTTSQGDYWVKTFSKSRAHWQKLIADIGSAFPNSFLTFEQAGIAGIIEMTGLDHSTALLAANREYGEPLKWLSSEEQGEKFFDLLQQRGAQILRGGRFTHISDICDKGTALKWLVKQYASLNEGATAYQILAVGDSQNDVAMLDEASYAVIVKSPTHTAPKLHTEKDKAANARLYHTRACGPEGWVEGVSKLLYQLDINHN